MSKRLLFLCFHALCIIFTYGRQFQAKDQQLIDSLQQYEFVEPDVSEPLTGESSGELLESEETRLLSFLLRGQTIKIRLTLNRDLFSPNFFERYITKHGYEIVNQTPPNCHFQGHVQGHQGVSVAAISTCVGVEGYFTLNEKTYLIQPVKALSGEVFHVLFESKHLNLPEYKCGHDDRENVLLYQNIIENVTLTKHRVRRDVLSETKYVELVMVNDKAQYERYVSNTSHRAITVVNIVDSTYRVHNVRVVLTMIEIWKDADQITYPDNNDVFLSNFIEYKKTVLDKNETTKNDHAVLITQKSLANNLAGYAGTLTICSQRSASLAYDAYSSTAYFATVVGHELGHSFGFNHVDVNKCPCAGDKSCLMSPTASEGPLKLSNCSQEQLKITLLKNYGTCLFNKPIEFYRHVQCGNGFIDKGEECDCGTKEHCEQLGNHCCNHSTCQLYPHSECSDGPCCENCQIRVGGSLCRDKVNDCDLPEYCDGKSAICAPDSYVHNGRPCTFGKEKSLCYLGVCHTYDYQCKRYWGPDGIYSLICNQGLNPYGSQVGFCKRFSDGSFMKCAAADVKCGKLHCEMTKQFAHRRPLFGPRPFFVQYGPYKCWSYHLTRDYPEFGLDIGMVETGSMCDENKVCYNNTCMDVNKVYKQPDCPNNCSGNGVCNNLGHCHCNYGYGCPNCSEKCDSDGGSIDSGNSCYCPGPNISTTVSTTRTNANTTVITTLEGTHGQTTREPTKDISKGTHGQTTREPTRDISKADQSSTTGEGTDQQTTHDPTGDINKGKGGGDKDKSEKSQEIIIIVLPVVVVVILIVMLLCVTFRSRILERCRKTRQPFSEPGIRYLSSEKLGEDKRDLGVPQYENMGVYEGKNTGEENLGFASLSFMPESKIDSKHVPNDTPTSPLSHDGPPQRSNPSSLSALPNTPDSPKTLHSKQL